MTKTVIDIFSESDLDSAAARFLDLLGERRHVAFDGPMGAGKTTFAAAVCRCLGVADDVASPTFSIVNEYHDASGHPVYHFDFYRIDDPADAVDLGLDDYFDSGCLCLLEWADNAGPLLPDDLVRVSVIVGDDGRRQLVVPCD